MVITLSSTKRGNFYSFFHYIKQIKGKSMTYREKTLSYDEFVFIISESLGLDRDEINEDTSFIDDLGIDSLSFMDCIIKLERKFGVKINISNIWELTSVKQAYDVFTKTLTAA
jgi:acyl carrier protein